MCGLRDSDRGIPRNRKHSSQICCPDRNVGAIFSSMVEKGSFVKEIESAVEIYERLRKEKYRIEILDIGLEFEFRFLPRNFHHLAGFQHLEDRTSIAAPVSTDRFYRDLKKNRISDSQIKESSFWEEAAERLRNFHRIEEMFNNPKLQIVVEFDQKKAASDIKADFYLYQREGNPLNGGAITYFNLFIGHDTKTDTYYPATFVVEPSRKYANGQNFYDCQITKIEQQGKETST